MATRNIGPGKHPDPPKDLGTKPLPITAISQPWYRIHRNLDEAAYFGRSGKSRFDAPAGEFGVLYVAATVEGAFIEGCIRDVGIGRAHRVVSTTYLRDRSLSRMSFSDSLRLVDLSGPGLAQVAADMRLCTAGGYRVAQRWSLAFWRHPDVPDGILWPSRHDPSRLCAALFDRLGGITTQNIGGFLDLRLRATLAALLDSYGIALV